MLSDGRLKVDKFVGIPQTLTQLIRYFVAQRPR